MDITEVTVVHHVALVLAALWAAVTAGWAHPAIFLLALLYLYAVNERYSMRLRRRIQYEERKFANQRRLLSDSESVRWLNHAVERIWPICMEQIASQQFLLPIMPWFLDKFKPWTAKKAIVQNLYLGRNPPMFTDIRVVSQSTNDDHLVLEIGMNFLSADDMDATLAVQVRKRLGFGITANMHVTGMHIEGKILVGVRFLQHWPFLGRVRVCFVEPPYFQMTVKPIFGHGLDVTELPGISGWLDRLLDVAFGQTLVEPNMLVIDLEKFSSAPTEGWFTVDEKPPIAHAKVEILKGADMKPSDLNGLADPYVKGCLGPYRFQTKIHKKTLSPKWLEEFKVPITSWESPNLLALQVRDKDPIFDDTLGDCSISINDLRGGQRHDMWLPLKNIKMGRIHVAITILEDELAKGMQDHNDEVKRRKPDNTSENTTLRASFSSGNHNTSESSEEFQKVVDEYEQISIEGLEKAGVWVHRPGSDVSQTWEPRKGRAWYHESKIHRESEHCGDSPGSSMSGSQQSDTSSDERVNGRKPHRHLDKIKKGLGKLGAVFHGSPRKESGEEAFPCPTPHANLRPLGERRISVKLVVDEDDLGRKEKEREPDGRRSSPEKAEIDGPSSNHFKSKAEGMATHGSKTAHNLKGMFSRKGLDKKKEHSENGEREGSLDAMEVDSLVLESEPVDITRSVDKEAALMHVSVASRSPNEDVHIST